MVFTTNIYKKLFSDLLVCNKNGNKDNGETGVDCGGGGCAPCEGTCYIYNINSLSL